MRILLIEPERPPVVREIDGSLYSMQTLVGGTIQALYPFEDEVALICNDDGKCLDLPLNRALYQPESGQLYDIIAGTFFLCGAPKDSEVFVSLTEAQMHRYQQRFAVPEYYARIGGQLLMIQSKGGDET